METICRNLRSQVQDFSINWHPPDQERTTEKDRQNDHWGGLSCDDWHGYHHSDCPYSRYLQTNVDEGRTAEPEGAGDALPVRVLSGRP